MGRRYRPRQIHGLSTFRSKAYKTRLQKRLWKRYGTKLKLRSRFPQRHGAAHARMSTRARVYRVRHWIGLGQTLFVPAVGRSRAPTRQQLFFPSSPMTETGSAPERCSSKRKLHICYTRAINFKEPSTRLGTTIFGGLLLALNLRTIGA